jgi:nucleoid-associated protein YgaU
VVLPAERPSSSSASAQAQPVSRPIIATADEQVEPVQHVVQRGENLWTISKLYYGSGRFYRALWKANSDQVKAPELLYVGTTIRVPPPEDLDRALIDPPKTTRSQGTANPSPTSAIRPRASVLRRDSTREPSSPADLVILPVGTPTSDPERVEPRDTPRTPPYHIVRKHETLRSIARDALSDPRREDEIRSLNLRVLGDSDELTPGMRLVLPDDARPVRR